MNLNTVEGARHRSAAKLLGRTDEVIE